MEHTGNKKSEGRLMVASPCGHRIVQALASPRPTQRVNDSYFPSLLWDGSWLTSSGPHAPTPATAMYFWCAQRDELFHVSQNMGLPVLKSGQSQANGDDKSFYVLIASQESLTNASMHYAFEGQMQ